MRCAPPWRPGCRGGSAARNRCPQAPAAARSAPVRLALGDVVPGGEHLLYAGGRRRLGGLPDGVPGPPVLLHLRALDE
eukprot:11157857-Lingulodinium_polyedra.AAC.1